MDQKIIDKDKDKKIVEPLEKTHVVPTPPPHVTTTPSTPPHVTKTPAPFTAEEVLNEAQKQTLKNAKRKEEVLKEIQDILREYRNLESEIPHSHTYWGLLNEYRAL